MRHPNYNHLLYFWATVRDGGIARAAESLHVTPQTISGQIKLLEGAISGRLLERKGRRLVPTELGATVFEYAEEIFSAGQDLARLLRGAEPRRRRAATVGVSDVVPNLVAWRVIAPLMRGPAAFRIVCHSGNLDTLVADLAAHRLDLVLSTSALPSDSGVRAFSHLLGECDVSFFAVPRLAARLRRGFPRSLDQAPFLLPTARSPNRRVLENWFAEQGVTPRVVGEFDDSALLKTFGQGGLGVFAAPSVIGREITRGGRVAVVGQAGSARARFYALTMERRIRHPAVAQVTEWARSGLFNAAGGRINPTRLAPGSAGPAPARPPSPPAPPRNRRRRPAAPAG